MSKQKVLFEGVSSVATVTPLVQFPSEVSLERRKVDRRQRKLWPQEKDAPPEETRFVDEGNPNTRD